MTESRSGGTDRSDRTDKDGQVGRVGRQSPSAQAPLGLLDAIEQSAHPQEGFGLVVECWEIVVREIALLFGEAAEMETTHRRVVGIILVPQQPVGGELVEIVGVDRVGAFPVEQDERIADHPDRVEGAAERALFARQGNLGVPERDLVDRLPVEVGGIGVAGLCRDFTRP